MLGSSLPRLPVSTTPVSPPHHPSHFALPCIFFLPFLSCYSSVRTGRVRSLRTKPIIGVLNYSWENTEFGSNYRQDCLQKPQLKIEDVTIVVRMSIRVRINLQWRLLEAVLPII